AARPRPGAGAGARVVAGEPARGPCRRDGGRALRAPGRRPGGGMSERSARTPFHFFGCWELREMLGRRAYDERELLEQLEEVPLDSIYFHTHSGFLLATSSPGGHSKVYSICATIQAHTCVAR